MALNENTVAAVKDGAELTALAVATFLKVLDSQGIPPGDALKLTIEYQRYITGMAKRDSAGPTYLFPPPEKGD